MKAASAVRETSRPRIAGALSVVEAFRLPGNPRNAPGSTHGDIDGVKRLALFALMLAAACSVTPSLIQPPVNLGISNGTTLSVSLFVNGEFVAVFVPHRDQPPIDPLAMPPLPWTVEARSASGRVLVSMHVEPGQVSGTTGPNGVTEYTGAFGRVDLSCGRLTIWAGDVMPSGPAPPPSVGFPGDCVP